MKRSFLAAGLLALVVLACSPARDTTLGSADAGCDDTEFATAYCGRVGKTCGAYSAVDSCGVTRDVDCGTCAAGWTCNATRGSCECAAGTTECSGACFDLATSAANCGSCGHACEAGEFCANGTCELACPEGQTACDGGCFDVATSRQHCGTCEKACATAEVCANGQCKVACPSGQVACAGGCFSLATERNHCGSCEKACGPGEVCVGGECDVSCPQGQAECNGRCFDLSAAQNHCGSCSNACDEGQVCAQGECHISCPTGQAVCNGACVTLATSREHCGRCDNACGAGQICAAGQCETSCGAGLTLCNGTCADILTDRANCGLCAHACGAGELCDAGVCKLVCAAELTTCDTECRDTRTDRAHCGACNHACAAGEVCENGVCALHCGGFASTLCDGACTNTQVDPGHCGSCTNACSAGTVCVAGVCSVPAVCTAPNVVCGSSCTSTQRDPANCGTCGFACTALTNAQPVCTLGTCHSACTFPYADCDGDLLTSGGNGCEMNLATSAANCGACGHACGAVAHGTASCIAGVCTLGTCAAGYADCDGQVANGCESTVSTDLNNCGTCHNVCGTGSTCAAGRCVTGSEDCTNANVLVNGPNSVGWYATTANYWTAAPSSSCPGSGSTYAPSGPDVVFQYNSNLNGFVEFSIDKPASNRWHMVISSTCGTITPNGSPYTPPVVYCNSDYSNSTVSTGFLPITSGNNLYLHMVSTTSGGAPLTNPMSIRVNAFDCTRDPATIISRTPDHGGWSTTLYPRFTMTMSRALDVNAGSFTVTGTMGTNLNFPVTQTANVAFSNSNKTVTISPKVAFSPGEVITVTWSGLQDTACNLAVPVQPWTVSIPTPCTTANGLVGTTVTRITPPSPFPTTHQNLGNVTPDPNPNGWVYLGAHGNASNIDEDMWRMKKDGSVAENARPLFDPSPGGAKEGYAPLLMDGNTYYSVEDNSSATTGLVWRITTDAGATWGLQDMATFGSSAPGVFWGAALQGGTIFLLPRTTSTGTAPTIWTVTPGTATPPVAAVKAVTLPNSYGYYYCSAIAVDSTYYYELCAKSSTSAWVLLRIERANISNIVELTSTDASLTPAWFPGSINGPGSILVADRNNDGLADFLYVRNGTYPEAYYVCNPAGTTPFVDRLTSWNTTTSNYGGLGYDPVANVLWGFDGASPQAVLKIQ